MIFFLLFLFLPSVNPSSDAVGYATNPETGVHHLLYDILCIQIRGITGNPFYTLRIMQALNALAAGMVLWLITAYLKSRKISSVPAVVALCGSFFGFMRFATENETYIFPLAFALAGAIAYTAGIRSGNYRRIIAGFCLAGVGIMFHQSYVFWWLAMGLDYILRSRPGFRFAIAMLVSGAMVTAVHVMAIAFSGSEFRSWWLGDAATGLVDLSPGWDNFKFTLISLVRSVVQVHGNIAVLLSRFPWLYAPAVISIIAFAAALYSYIKEETYKAGTSSPLQFRRLWFMIFLLQLLFAWFSVGNAEFMVMLPTVLVLWYAEYRPVQVRTVLFLAIALFIWNMAFAIIPMHVIRFENREYAYKKMVARGPHIFVSHNKTQAENDAEYFSAMDGKSFSSYDIQMIKSPADIGNLSTVDSLIQSALKSNFPVFTDCPLYPEPLNRHSVLNGQINDLYFKKYRLIPADSFDNFYGRVRIFRVER